MIIVYKDGKFWGEFYNLALANIAIKNSLYDDATIWTYERV